MHITVPPSFKEVPFGDFQDYLKWCNDYTCDAIGCYHVYTFRGGKRFAYVDLGRDIVFVSPEFLADHNGTGSL